VISRIKLNRDPAFVPLAQVMMNWKCAEQEMSSIQLRDVIAEPLLSETRTSKFDITVVLAEHERDMYIEIEYSADLFDESRIDRLADHLRILLTHGLTAWDQKISEMALLSEEERRRLVAELSEVEPDDVDY